jgi:hypothetical protein
MHCLRDGCATLKGFSFSLSADTSEDATPPWKRGGKVKVGGGGGDNLMKKSVLVDFKGVLYDTMKKVLLWKKP